MGYFQLLVTKHQFFYGLIRRLTVKEHFIYLLNNRQLNLIFFDSSMAALAEYTPSTTI